MPGDRDESGFGARHDLQRDTLSSRPERHFPIWVTPRGRLLVVNQQGNMGYGVLLISISFYRYRNRINEKVKHAIPWKLFAKWYCPESFASYRLG